MQNASWGLKGRVLSYDTRAIGTWVTGLIWATRFGLPCLREGDQRPAAVDQATSMMCFMLPISLAMTCLGGRDFMPKSIEPPMGYLMFHPVVGNTAALVRNFLIHFWNHKTPVLALRCPKRRGKTSRARPCLPLFTRAYGSFRLALSSKPATFCLAWPIRAVESCGTSSMPVFIGCKVRLSLFWLLVWFVNFVRGVGLVSFVSHRASASQKAVEQPGSQVSWVIGQSEALHTQRERVR